MDVDDDERLKFSISFFLLDDVVPRVTQRSPLPHHPHHVHDVRPCVVNAEHPIIQASVGTQRVDKAKPVRVVGFNGGAVTSEIMKSKSPQARYNSNSF